MAKAVTEAAKAATAGGLGQRTAPALVALIQKVAALFGVRVSQKAAAEAVPVIGAVGGAAINVVFIEHYQTMARAHFSIRRLERAYSPRLVRKEYERLLAEHRKAMEILKA